MKPGHPDRIVMSFHGLPCAGVAAGVPYETQVRESGRLIATELGWNDRRTVVAFQSRFGAQEWLQPYTAATLAALGREGLGRVDVICPGFAADCLETLEEIAQEGRDTFRAAGGKEFHYIPTTNDTPSWMTALATIFALHGKHYYAPVYPTLFAAGAVFGLNLLLRRTRIGIAMRAVAENADRSKTLGIPIGRVQVLAWALAGLLGSITIFQRSTIVGLALIPL